MDPTVDYILLVVGAQVALLLILALGMHLRKRR